MVGRGKWILRTVTYLLASLPLCAQTRPSPAASQRQAATQAAAEGHTDRALRLYAECLAKTPDWTEGWWEYGKLLYGSHQFPEAARAFGRLTRLAPGNPLGFALLGLCEYEEGDWNNASLHLNKSLAMHVGMPAAISGAAAYHLGLALLHQHDGEDALMVLKTLYRQSPDYPGLAPALGAAQLNLDQVPPSDSPLLAAVQTAGVAAIAVLQDRKKDAEDAYRTLLAQFPAQPYVHLGYGILLESEHRDEEATGEFLAESKVNPGSAVPWLWLGRIALDQQDAARSREYALKARKLNPDDALSFLIEGRGLMLEREWQSALAPLREAERREPQSSEVHYSLASVYKELHRSKDAAQERQLFLQTTNSGNEP